MQHSEQRQRHQKFYQTKAWKQLRLYKLSIDPLCEICLKKGLTVPANEVDHIEPLAIDWSKRLDITNLQSLDKICHSRKTAGEEKIMKRNKRIDATHEDLEDFTFF